MPKPTKSTEGTTHLALSETPHGTVQFLDQKKSIADIPLCCIPEVKGTKFTKNKVVSAFWSPKTIGKRMETLQEAKKRLATIPDFEAGSDNQAGPGMYPATILATADTLSELLHRKVRTCRPSPKVLETLHSSSSSSSKSSSSSSSLKSSDSSGVHSSSSNSKRGPDNSPVPFLEMQDEDPEQTSALQLEINALKKDKNRYKEEARRHKKEVLRLTEDLKRKQDELEASRTKIQRLEDLNFEYQKTLLAKVAPAVADDTTSAVHTVEVLRIEQVTPTEPSQSTNAQGETDRDMQDDQATQHDETADMPKDPSGGLVKIHDGVYISEVAYTEEYKKFLKSAMHMPGSVNDKKFVIDLTEKLFKIEELVQSTVKGTMCNARKETHGNNVGAALCPLRKAAIERTLLRRVSMLNYQKISRKTQFYRDAGQGWLTITLDVHSPMQKKKVYQDSEED
ncbi:uncharacterized protein LOC117652696 [Thrips palmi]|uniref:Uncharacterized protein LOC117652696 n=1 Tax=Thrips palmi TaxID=161013 RepID=A0A6P9A803_THRPL|nr:uncharacterized protein LOC117652696 [Thrips palmi]